MRMEGQMISAEAEAVRIAKQTITHDTGVAGEPSHRRSTAVLPVL